MKLYHDTKCSKCGEDFYSHRASDAACPNPYADGRSHSRYYFLGCDFFDHASPVIMARVRKELSA